MSLEEIRKYDTFIYDHYKIEEHEKCLNITFYFEIPGLETFTPSLEIPKLKHKKVDDLVENIVFHLGMVEMMSYYKCCLPPNILVKCGSLNEEQTAWFKKLYFLGLGEFFYTNNIEVHYDDFVTFHFLGKERKPFNLNYDGNGVMIAIGGGKDSCVSLELLKEEKDRSAFIINPKPVMLHCAHVSGLDEDSIFKIKRNLDLKIVELNKRGFLNGHTPFSSMVAFTSFLTAYLNDKKYIVLSNEASANESNVVGTNVNHQYSKSYEFEQDFNAYTKRYFNIPIHYFSFLRPINEYQIGKLFSNMPAYHSIFKSCNPGSKENPWIWCNACAKCLFVYAMLSPFLYKEELISIFKEDLFEKKELLSLFIDLLGYGENKPFDCVGTYEEINYAICKTIKKLGGNLPFLLKYYQEHYPLTENQSLENYWNPDHQLNERFEGILKRAIKND